MNYKASKPVCNLEQYTLLYTMYLGLQVQRTLVHCDTCVDHIATISQPVSKALHSPQLISQRLKTATKPRRLSANKHMQTILQVTYLSKARW